MGLNVNPWRVSESVVSVSESSQNAFSGSHPIVMHCNPLNNNYSIRRQFSTEPDTIG